MPIKARIRKDKIKARHMYKEKQLRIRKHKINISFLLEEALYRYPLLSPQGVEQILWDPTLE